MYYNIITIHYSTTVYSWPSQWQGVKLPINSIAMIISVTLTETDEDWQSETEDVDSY